MDKKRIEEIRKLGDTLAAYVKEQEEKRFFRNLYVVQRADEFRTLLIRADKKYATSGKGLLFGLDTYCTVFFEEDGETLKPDWKFARDLVLIRMIEWLHTNTKNWLVNHPDAFPEEKELDPTSANQEE